MKNGKIEVVGAQANDNQCPFGWTVVMAQIQNTQTGVVQNLPTAVSFQCVEGRCKAWRVIDTDPDGTEHYDCARLLVE